MTAKKTSPKNNQYKHRQALETRPLRAQFIRDSSQNQDISRLRKDLTVKKLQSMQAQVFTGRTSRLGQNEKGMLKNIREIDTHAFKALVKTKLEKLNKEAIKEGFRDPEAPGWYEESNMINTITRDEIDALKERSESIIVHSVHTNAIAHMDRRQEKKIELETNGSKVDLKTFGKSKEVIQSTNRLEDGMKYVHHPRYLFAQNSDRSMHVSYNLTCIGTELLEQVLNNQMIPEYYFLGKFIQLQPNTNNNAKAHLQQKLILEQITVQREFYTHLINDGIIEVKTNGNNGNNGNNCKGISTPETGCVKFTSGGFEQLLRRISFFFISPTIQTLRKSAQNSDHVRTPNNHNESLKQILGDFYAKPLSNFGLRKMFQDTQGEKIESRVFWQSADARHKRGFPMNNRKSNLSSLLRDVVTKSTEYRTIQINAREFAKRLRNNIDQENSLSKNAQNEFIALDQATREKHHAIYILEHEELLQKIKKDCNYLIQQVNKSTVKDCMKLIKVGDESCIFVAPYMERENLQLKNKIISKGPNNGRTYPLSDGISVDRSLFLKDYLHRTYLHINVRIENYRESIKNLKSLSVFRDNQIKNYFTKPRNDNNLFTIRRLDSLIEKTIEVINDSNIKFKEFQQSKKQRSKSEKKWTETFNSDKDKFIQRVFWQLIQACNENKQKYGKDQTLVNAFEKAGFHHAHTLKPPSYQRRQFDNENVIRKYDGMCRDFLQLVAALPHENPKLKTIMAKITKVFQTKFHHQFGFVFAPFLPAYSTDMKPQSCIPFDIFGLERSSNNSDISWPPQLYGNAYGSYSSKNKVQLPGHVTSKTLNLNGVIPNEMIQTVTGLQEYKYACPYLLDSQYDDDLPFPDAKKPVYSNGYTKKYWKRNSEGITFKGGQDHPLYHSSRFVFNIDETTISTIGSTLIIKKNRNTNTLIDANNTKQNPIHRKITDYIEKIKSETLQYCKDTSKLMFSTFSWQNIIILILSNAGNENQRTSIGRFRQGQRMPKEVLSVTPTGITGNNKPPIKMNTWTERMVETNHHNNFIKNVIEHFHINNVHFMKIDEHWCASQFFPKAEGIVGSYMKTNFPHVEDGLWLPFAPGGIQNSKTVNLYGKEKKLYWHKCNESKENAYGTVVSCFSWANASPDMPTPKRGFLQRTRNKLMQTRRNQPLLSKERLQNNMIDSKDWARILQLHKLSGRCFVKASAIHTVLSRGRNNVKRIKKDLLGDMLRFLHFKLTRLASIRLKGNKKIEYLKPSKAQAKAGTRSSGIRRSKSGSGVASGSRASRLREVSRKVSSRASKLREVSSRHTGIRSRRLSKSPSQSIKKRKPRTPSRHQRSLMHTFKPATSPATTPSWSRINSIRNQRAKISTERTRVMPVEYKLSSSLGFHSQEEINQRKRSIIRNNSPMDRLVPRSAPARTTPATTSMAGARALGRAKAARLSRTGIVPSVDSGRVGQVPHNISALIRRAGRTGGPIQTSENQPLLDNKERSNAQNASGSGQLIRRTPSQETMRGVRGKQEKLLRKENQGTSSSGQYGLPKVRRSRGAEWLSKTPLNPLNSNPDFGRDGRASPP